MSYTNLIPSQIKQQKLLFRPHLWGGGWGGGGGAEELYTQLGFFQTILTDRYIHRREMWVVSLKSCGIKKCELLRFEFLCKTGIFGMILFNFIVIFVQIKIFFYRKYYFKITFHAANEKILRS